MDNMIEVLQAFENRVWECHRRELPNERGRQCVSSFVVQYEFGTEDNIGSLFLMATKSSLCIKTFYGKDPDCGTYIYAPREIYSISKAESILNWMEIMLADSAVEGYFSDIKLMSQEIEKKYNA